jgi:hypothetical protein
VYLLSLRQALSFYLSLYLLQEVGLNLDQLAELEQHVPRIVITSVSFIAIYGCQHHQHRQHLTI